MTSALLRPAPATRAVADAARDADPVLAVERERARLADQLHSGLMQSLVVIRHSLGRTSAPAAEAPTGLPTADEAVAGCLAETRRLVWHLRPRTLDATLAHALDELAHRITADTGACLVVDTDGVVMISEAQAALVYRVVQAAALATPAGVALAATVVADEGAVRLTLIGASSEVAADPALAESASRAAAYAVEVDVVTS